MSKITFRSWLDSTKEYSKSPIGSINTNLIITSFITFGCILGSIQMKINKGFSAVAFLIFAFGILNLYSLYLMFNQKKQIKKTINAMKEIEEIK